MIEIEDVKKIYRLGTVEVAALAGVSLQIARSEVVAIVGQSGSGKSTLMNIIGCLDKPTSGKYRLDGTGVETLGSDELAAVRNRKIGFVFQSFNLLSRVSARRNVELPLLYAGVGAGRRERAAAALSSVGLADRMDHRPTELSGGQQQRVVLARAIVIEPDVLLMDEPLSNLDTEMRVHLRGEIRALQRQIGFTTIYVTHDQEEALMMSDRVAVMSGGRVEQVGTPVDIFHRPQTRFVASFIGESNFLPATRVDAGGSGSAIYEVPGGGRLPVPVERAQAAGARAELAFRSHDLILGAAADGGWNATVTDTQFYGATIRLVLELGPGHTVQVALTGRAGQALPTPGSRVGLALPPDSLWLFPAAAP